MCTGVGRVHPCYAEAGCAHYVCICLMLHFGSIKFTFVEKDASNRWHRKHEHPQKLHKDAGKMHKVVRGEVVGIAGSDTDDR